MSADRHAALVQSAMLRSNILAYFNREGGVHTSTQVADAINQDRKKVFAQLQQLAESEQLLNVGKQGREYLFRKPGESAPEEPFGPLPAVEQKVGRIVRKQPQEIELVVDGTVIVIGKNPATGRIRVTIDS